MKVFVVEHERILEEDFQDVKLIGVFSSKETADAAVSSLREMQGFRDFLDGFHVDEIEVDRVYWETGFVTMFTKED